MKKLFAVGVCLLGAGLLAGCETASRPPAALPISVMAPTASASGLDAGQSPAQALTVTATVNNDSSNKGVTWMCTFTPSGGTAAACANFPSTTTNCSACMAMFTAPGSPGSVSITATSIADSTKSSSPLKFNVNAPPTFPAASQVATQLQTSSPSCNASSPGGTVTLGPTAGRQYSCGFAAALLGGTPPFTWSAPGLPAGLTINSSTGVISGTPTSVTKLRSGGSVAGRLTASSDPMVTVTATDSSPNKVLMSINIAINVALGFTNVAVPSSGTAGQAYTGTATVGGGTTPYHWTVSGLPTGLTSNAATATTTVTISGTPTQSGTFMVTISVTDSAASPATVSTTITLTIAPPPPLTITTTSLPTADVNLPYNASLQATGGIPPDTWSAGTGTLPAGLTLSPGGQISGTPTMAGTFGFIVQVVDSETPSMMATKSLSITINPQLAVTTTTLPDGTVGTAYSATLASTGGTTPVTWAVTTGTLPASLTLNPSTGVISGTPTTAATSTFSVTATDHLNQTATQSLSITIHPAPLSITTTTLPNGTINSPYNQTVSATGGTPPYTFSLATGSLPTGLSLAMSTGVISGTPTTAGTFPFTVQVADSASPPATATQPLSITINAAVACTQTQTNLCGRFSFFFQGANAMGPVAIAGSILTDGTNVVSGIMDLNSSGSAFAGFLINPSPASHFSFDTNRFGTLTLNVTSGGVTFTTTFAVVLAPDRPEGRLIAFDSSGLSGSGAIGAPDSTAFNATAITGNFALSFIGGNNVLNKAGMIGVFAADGSCGFTTATNGSVTINVGGTISAGLNFTGNCVAINSTTGRGVAGFTLAGTGNPFTSILHFALYVFNKNTLFFMGIDPLATQPMLSGFAESQAFPQPFSNASIPCGVGANLPCVFATISPSDVAIGLATVTSQNPGMMTFIIDANVSGTIVSNTTIMGFTYTVHPAGNGTITPPSGNPIVKHNIDFVIGGAGAFFLDEGTDVGSGLLEPQQSTTLHSPTPVEFLAVTQATTPAPSTMAVAFATLSASTGSGSISGVADGNGGTPTSGITFSGTYELASNGRATGSVTLPGLATFTFYVVKGGRFVLIGQTPGQGGALFEFGRHGGDVLP